MSVTDPDDVATSVPFREAFWTWCRVAALSFGGPAGQIAVMHRILIDEKKWISENRFLHALNYCMLLPGPEAQQLATYIGWLMHGTLGGVVAGTLFILPGIASILTLSVIYAEYQQTDFVQAVFFGLKPAVLAIVVEAVLRIGRRVLKNGVMVAIAATAFVAIFFFHVPFPILIIAAGLVGLVGGRLAPAYFVTIKSHARATDEPHRSGAESPQPQKPLLLRSVLVSVVFMTLWFVPLIVVRYTLGPDSVYFQEGMFFSKAAVVTFGGAYSVLAYIGQQAVEKYAWLRPGEMLDGLGMAETTPGPLIMVVQFVGFLGAYRHPGPFSPLTAGVVGSLLTTWVTFVPCFFWIFLGAPYIERLRGSKSLNASLSVITASVVGVILNLAVWFAMHMIFSTVKVEQFSIFTLQVPDLATVNIASCAIAALAFVLTFYFKKGMVVTLAACAATGAVVFLVGKYV